MRLKCSEFIEMVENFIDSSLHDEERGRCEHHLAECPYCRDYLKTYKDTVDLLKTTLNADGCNDPELEVDKRLMDRLMDAKKEIDD